MNLNDILSGAEDQARGRWFSLLHPVTGDPAGVRLLVAGPDSRVTADAMATMTDELAEAADDQGRVSGKARADIHRRFLARCVLDWDVIEGGEDMNAQLPFTFERMLRLLSVAWVKNQVDTFAANRSVYFQPVVRDDAAA